MCAHKNRSDDNHLTFMPVVHPLRFTVSTRAVDIIDIKTTREKREGADIYMHIVCVCVCVCVYSPFARADWTFDN